MSYYIDKTRTESAHWRAAGNGNINAPIWMRSDGLTADDWQVITQYIQVLKPLKTATKKLEGRGKSGRYGALYEVYPTFEYVLRTYEEIAKPYELVDFNESDAPEDYLIINI